MVNPINEICSKCGERVMGFDQDNFNRNLKIHNDKHNGFVPIIPKIITVSGDLNNDQVFDEKDLKIASETLTKGKELKKGQKKKK